MTPCLRHIHRSEKLIIRMAKLEDTSWINSVRVILKIYLLRNLSKNLKLLPVMAVLQEMKIVTSLQYLRNYVDLQIDNDKEL